MKKIYKSLVYIMIVILQPLSCSTTHIVNETNNGMYFERAKAIWTQFVPESGQAKFRQGELLRSIEKLRDEAQRNGNGNFDDSCHTIMIEYLRTYLVDDELFNKSIKIQIGNYLDKLANKESPYLNDDIYDFLSDRVVDWYDHFGDKVVHEKNKNLYC